MSDTFLERFEQRRQEKLAADRSFPLAGETLVHKASVAPEIPMRLQETRAKVTAQLLVAKELIAKANGKGVNADDIVISDDELLLMGEETVLACLEPESHDAWARLRDPKAAYPLDFDDVMSVADYLVSRVTGIIPTVAPVDSSTGRRQTASTSKARSRSTAKTPAGSG